MIFGSLRKSVGSGILFKCKSDENILENHCQYDDAICIQVGCYMKKKNEFKMKMCAQHCVETGNIY